MTFLISILTIILRKTLPSLLDILIKKKYFYLISALVVILSLATLGVAYYGLDNRGYIVATEQDKAEKLIKKLIHKCGNGSSISLGVISSKKITDAFGNSSVAGKFQLAFAMEQGVLINLREHNPKLYKSPINIDQITYNLFISLDKNPLYPPFSINLDQSKYQNTGYDLIDDYLNRTEWGQNNKLKKIYLSSIVRQMPFTENILVYTITFVKSIDFKPENGCDEVNTDLRNLKKDLKTND